MTEIANLFCLIRPVGATIIWLGVFLAALPQASDPVPAPMQPRLTVTKGLEKPVSALYFTPDSKKIAICQLDKIKFFDTRDGKEIAALSDIDGCGVLGFRAGGGEMVTTNGQTIFIVDLKTNKVDRTIKLAGQVRGPRLTDDGNAVFYSREDQMGEDQILTMVDLTTGKAVIEIKAIRHYGCLAVSPDGKWAATGRSGTDPKIVVYDLKAGKEHLTIDAYPDTKERPGGTGVTALVFSPDSKSLLSLGGKGGQPLIKWETATGKRQSELAESNGNRAMAWSPDGKTIAVAGFAKKRGNGRLGLWNPAALQIFDDEVLGEIDYAAQLVFSPDGKTLAVAGVTEDGKSFALWDVPRPGDKKP
jgi:WD40 repeat protein